MVSGVPGAMGDCVCCACLKMCQTTNTSDPPLPISALTPPTQSCAEESEPLPPWETESTEAPIDEDCVNYVYPKPLVKNFYLQQRVVEAYWLTAALVNFTYFIKFLFARLREFLQDRGLKTRRGPAELDQHTDFVPIIGGKESLFIRNIYRTGSDVVNRVISDVPGTVTRVKERFTDDFGWSYQYTGKSPKCLNMGSYNYLGFAQNSGPTVEIAAKAIDEFGLHSGASRHGFPVQSFIPKVEARVAAYLGVEAAMLCPMGFNTNAMNIPALVGPGCLILSDALNHASLVLGCRLSGAKVVVFKHNDPVDLESKLSTALQAASTAGNFFKKVLIVCEGIYSMEGTICDLPTIIAIKKKYKAYLFLDEAHSIGALGPHGRGVVDYFGLDPNDVDILMGTLTKSFAAAGGYVAGSAKLISHLRTRSHDCFYGTTLAAPIAHQVLATMDLLDTVIDASTGETEAQRRVKKLMRNTHYLRALLEKHGFLIYGHRDSPVVPCMFFYCTRGIHFLRETLQRGLALVGVCYPAVPMTKCRARFCLSTGHTKQQLDWVVKTCNQVAKEAGVKYAANMRHKLPVVY